MKLKPISMHHSIEQLHQLEQLKKDDTPYYTHLKRCVDIAQRWSYNPNNDSKDNANTTK